MDGVVQFVTLLNYIDDIKIQMVKIGEIIGNKVITNLAFNYEKYFIPEIIP